MSTAGIVGLGLMGGSLARDLAASGWVVLGADRDDDALHAARSDGVIAGPLDVDDPDRLGHLDLLVLAVPVGAAPAWLHRLAPRVPAGSDLIITDVGSTKRSVTSAATAAGLGRRFVGSHPMAGHHRSGWTASRTGLFRAATVWLCPAPEADARAVERVAELWRGVGAVPETVDPVEHDRRVARTSHLPQLAATALAGVLARSGLGPHDLGPGGRDTTRLAGSDPDMWLDILLDNADHVAPALDSLAHEILAIAHTLRHARQEPLRTHLTTAHHWSHPP